MVSLDRGWYQSQIEALGLWLVVFLPGSLMGIPGPASGCQYLSLSSCLESSEIRSHLRVAKAEMFSMPSTTLGTFEIGTGIRRFYGSVLFATLELPTGQAGQRLESSVVMQTGF